MKPHRAECTVFAFIYGPTIMQRKTSEARIAQATHLSNLDKLLSPDSSQIKQEPESLIKDSVNSINDLLHTSVLAGN